MSLDRDGEELDAIVVSVRTVGEADCLVTLLTAERGKLDARARGARKSRRRFGAGLQVGACVRARISPKAVGASDLLGLVILTDPSQLGRDLEAFAWSRYACELAEQLTEREEAPLRSDRAYFALSRALDAMIATPRDAISLRALELALLAAQGWLPAFASCCVCGSPLDEGAVPYDLARGGALCGAHGENSPRLGAALLTLAATVAADEVDVRSVAATLGSGSAALRRGLRDLCLEALAPHLRRPLRSIALLSELGRPRAGREPAVDP